jgi:hypothetical protein
VTRCLPKDLDSDSPLVSPQSCSLNISKRRRQVRVRITWASDGYPTLLVRVQLLLGVCPQSLTQQIYHFTQTSLPWIACPSSILYLAGFMAPFVRFPCLVADLISDLTRRCSPNFMTCFSKLALDTLIVLVCYLLSSSDFLSVFPGLYRFRVVIHFTYILTMSHNLAFL